MTEHTAAVVMPCYNMDKWIAGALDSVLRQTRAPTQIIVVDDGSTDHSTDIVAKYPAQLVSLSHRGAPQARNAGLMHVTADTVVFFDPDDVMYAWYLADTLEIFDAEDDEELAVVHGGLDADGVTVQGGYWTPAPNVEVADLWYNNPGIWNSSLIRTAAIKGVGGYDHNMFPAEDWDLWMELRKRGWTFKAIDKPLYHWRDRPEGWHNTINHNAQIGKMRTKHAEVYP